MQDFFDAQIKNIEGGIKTPRLNELVRSIHEAYSVAIQSVPADLPPMLFRKLLLVCHKSLLSAASLIVSSLSDDSVAITRRAAEAAKLALAVKIDPKNGEQWLSYEKRHARWLARLENTKPKSFRVEFKGINGDADIEFLDRYIGILSDAYVHFTPEYFDILDWEILGDDGGDELYLKLNYFHRSARERDLQLLQMCGIHGRMLQIFDRCYDNRLSSEGGFKTTLAEFWRAGKEFSDWYASEYREPSGAEL
jgi:hypothetical protein